MQYSWCQFYRNLAYVLCYAHNLMTLNDISIFCIIMFFFAPKHKMNFLNIFEIDSFIEYKLKVINDTYFYEALHCIYSFKKA